MEFLCQGNEGSCFSLYLKEALHAQKNSVIENNAVLGAVYVDLRYHRLLSPEQRECAKNTFSKIVPEQSLDKPQTEDFNSSTEDVYSDFVARSILDDALEALLVKHNQVPSNYREYRTSEMMIDAIEELSNAPRLPKAEDNKYWVNHSNQIYEHSAFTLLLTRMPSISRENNQRLEIYNK